MEKEGHYVVVGIFLLVTLLIAVVLVFWLAESKHHTETSIYEIHFEGSVSGLDRGGEVRYLGVKIGQIKSISLIPDQPSKVRVTVEIEDGAPIYESTVAQPKLKGVTGVAFIELIQGEGAEVRLTGTDKPPYPVIQSRKSEIDRLINALPGIAAQADEVLARVNDMLNEENIENATALFTNLRQLSEELPELSAELYRTLQASRRAVDNVEQLTDKAGPVAIQTLDNLNQASQDMAHLMTRLEGLFAQNDERINVLMGEGLDDLQTILTETKKTMHHLRKLTASLERRPSGLLYEPTHYGVEVAQ